MNQIVPVDDKPKRQLLEVVDPIPVLDTSRFEHMQRIANVMAQSTLIPESLYKEKDKELPLSQIISNCFLVVNQAVRWGLDPFAVAQSVAVVRGKLCYEGKLVAAVLDAKLGVRLHHHFTGDPTKPEYRIYTADRPFDEELVALLKPGVSIPGVRLADGSVADFSTGDKGAWGAIKNYRRMLTYRNSRDWARFFEPAVLLGVYTPDELMELADNARAERAREVPAVLQRLQASAAAGEPQDAREGFDRSHVARETAEPSSEAEIEHEPSSPVIPNAPDDAGSESPSSPQDSAADNSELHQESGDGESDAQAPVDGTTASGSPAGYDRAGCIKAFLTTATDKDMEVKERRDLLEQMKEWWKQALADDLDFVKTCLSTSDKVAKGEIGEQAARRYLESIP